MIRKILGDDAIYGWELRPSQDPEDTRVYLVPSFAPGVALPAQWVTNPAARAEADRRPYLLLGDHQRTPSKCWRVYEDCPAGRAQAILARVVVPIIDAREKYEQTQARIRANEQRDDEARRVESERLAEDDSGVRQSRLRLFPDGNDEAESDLRR